MDKIICIDEAGLTLKQVMDCVADPAGAMIRRDGHIIARIEPADDLDLDDEVWAQFPEQVRRGAAARERYARGEMLAHEELKRRLSSGQP